MKLILILGIFVFHFILLMIYRKYLTHAIFEDIWYINMDRSTERRDYMRAHIQSLGPKAPVYRWPGVDGHKLTEDDYNKLEIPVWSRPAFTAEARKKIRKGEIGCYLSHLTLLQHLSTLSTVPNKGHLILEDDVELDPKFFNLVESGMKNVPADWDIITFGITEKDNNPHVIDVRKNIGRTIWMNNDYAYLVKHSSLEKIIKKIAVIGEPIDTTLGRASRLYHLNIYSYVPPIVVARKQNDTTMNGV
jgi:glycosyl transferase family 25